MLVIIKSNPRYKVWIQVLMRQEDWSSVVKKGATSGATQQRKNPSQLKMHQRTYVEFIDLIKPEPLQPTQGIAGSSLGKSVNLKA